MSEQDLITRLLTNTMLSRRSFLKWSAVLGGTAALASGGINVGLKATATAEAAPAAAPKEGKWVTAACWHNCGGHRCLNKAYIVDGVVVRQKTDDTHVDSPDMPQNRGCARGRSQRHQVFGADRLKYPMKRKNWAPGGGKKELRGKDEWVRISWEEALTLVANEIIRIQGKYGPGSIVSMGSEINRTLTLFGGYTDVWGSTSWGTWLDTGPIVGLGDGLSITSHNDRLDLRNSELIVIWGENPAWSTQGNAMYFFQQAKKAGAKFIFVDPLYNDSASVLADEWIPIRPATDHTMLLGMAYTLIKEDSPANPLIDWDFLNRCTVGFDAEHMPKGADPKDNFKDYVLGTYDGLPKTPEWASEICGVDPARIRRLAIEIGMKTRAALLTGWATARVNNADTWPQMFMTLGCMTGHIGKSGHMTGVSCWEKAGNGGPNLIDAGGSGMPSVGSNPVKSRLNNNELWDAILTGKYTAGYKDVKDINIQMIYHGGGSALNQKVGMPKGIQAHRKVEFVVSHSHFLTTNSKYADIVLPVTTQWERWGYVKGNREVLIWASQVTEPLYEAKDDIWIAAELAKRLGLDASKVLGISVAQQVINQIKGATVIKDDGKTKEPLVTITADDVKALAEQGIKVEPQTGRIGLNEFREIGQYQVPRKPGDKLGFIAFEAFRQDPEKNAIKTATGKFEIYSQAHADFIKKNGWTEVRPIPTYNKPIEGYEDTFRDWKTKTKNEFPLQLVTIHYRRRSHSIFDNIPQLREVFPQEFMMNPIDAATRGLKTGDIALIRSRHGKVIRRVFVTPRLMPGVVMLGEGAWAEVDDETGIDKAGATNTLNGAIPTGQGHQGWNSCNVAVEKYDGTLEPDAKWPQRIPLKGA
jgi:anaerobic dimethyl sulfoxide reductase subunit A